MRAATTSGFSRRSAGPSLPRAFHPAIVAASTGGCGRDEDRGSRPRRGWVDTHRGHHLPRAGPPRRALSPLAPASMVTSISMTQRAGLLTSRRRCFGKCAAAACVRKRGCRRTRSAYLISSMLFLRCRVGRSPAAISSPTAQSYAAPMRTVLSPRGRDLSPHSEFLQNGSDPSPLLNVIATSGQLSRNRWTIGAFLLVITNAIPE